MKLCRLVYISECSEALGEEELATVMQASTERNASLGISGLLLFSGGNFIQVLEGDPLHVRTLYKKIAADPRHKNVKCLLEQEASVRLFPEWGMKLADARRAVALDQKRIEKALIHLRLADDTERSQAALDLLSEFRTQLMSEAA